MLLLLLSSSLSLSASEDFLDKDEDTEEDFMDWADRIRQEYVTKQRARAQREAAKVAARSGHRKRRGAPSEEEQRSHKEQLDRLQREHLQYLERAARKEEETRKGKKQRYDKRCEHTFGSGSAGGASQKRLSYSDIPWPTPRGSVAEMLEVMLHGADRADVQTFRKLLRRQQAIWHPDKFAQRCGERLEEADKQKILDTVMALSKELNRLAQSLR